MSGAAFGAAILQGGATAIAGYTASMLLDRHPEAAERFGPSAQSHWQTHFRQRVLDLAAALAFEEPRLFVSRVDWERQAWRARELPEETLAEGLRCLREVVGEQLPDAGRAAADRYLAAAIESMSREPLGEERALDAAVPAERLALEYLATVLGGDARGGIEGVLAAVADGLEPKRAYLDVVLAAQREVGRLWHAGQLGVHEEHLVTSTTRRLLDRLVEVAPRAEANGHTVVSSAVAGSAHDLGPRVVADFFEMAGWRSVCLGADCPPRSVAEAAAHFDADLVALSATLTSDLPKVEETIRKVREANGDRAKILVGGMVFGAAPDLWRRVGADGMASSAEEAVPVGLGLLAGD